MPYQTNWSPFGVTWVFYDDVSAEEIREANEAFYNDPRSETARYQVIDARRVNYLEWDEKEIKETSAVDYGSSKVIPDLKVAFVANKEAVWEAIEKYLDISKKLNSSWEFEKFLYIEDAHSWVRKHEA